MRAGILLYTLSLSLIFSLLLQYYLQAVVNTRKQRLLQRERLQTQLMIKLTAGVALEEEGTVFFDKGMTHYKKTDQGLQVEVELKNRKLIN